MAEALIPSVLPEPTPRSGRYLEKNWTSGFAREAREIRDGITQGLSDRATRKPRSKPRRSRVAPVAGRGERTLLQCVVPGTAAVHTAGAIAAAGPGRTVSGRIGVTRMIAVLDPLHGVAGHVIETELVGGE